MPTGVEIPLSMLVVFASAKLLSECLERLGQPGIVGEILAGVLIGPHVLGWMRPNGVLELLSDLGVMFLLFRVGLDLESSELLKVKGTALAVALAGVIVPFGAGWGISVAWGLPGLECMFLGAALVATSVGITARVLSQRGLLDARASKIILAAAVIDDVLGLIVLSVVSSMAKGSLNYVDLTLTALLAAGFTVLVARWGTPTMRHLTPKVTARISLAEGQFAMAMSVLFGLSLLAVYAGVAAIVGAFLAGMALSDSVERRVHEQTGGVTELLTPFFLAGIGLHFDTTAFREPSTLWLALAILLAAILSKTVGCGLGALHLGRREALRVGVGMAPRGEVGMVVAQIGLGFGVIVPGVYAIIVLMSVLTTVLAPPMIQWAYRDAE
jgi:Kef-type K+ transport system membrane component KefB